MPTKKTAFVKWVDRKIASDAQLKRMVEENLLGGQLEITVRADRRRRPNTAAG